MINGEYSNPHRDSDIYIIFNASMTSRYYEIPPSYSRLPWMLALDTFLASPDDITINGREVQLHENRYHVKKLSTVVFVTSFCR